MIVSQTENFSLLRAYPVVKHYLLLFPNSESFAYDPIGLGRIKKDVMVY